MKLGSCHGLVETEWQKDIQESLIQCTNVIQKLCLLSFCCAKYCEHLREGSVSQILFKIESKLFPTTLSSDEHINRPSICHVYTTCKGWTPTDYPLQSYAGIRNLRSFKCIPCLACTRETIQDTGYYSASTPYSIILQCNSISTQK